MKNDSRYARAGSRFRLGLGLALAGTLTLGGFASESAAAPDIEIQREQQPLRETRTKAKKRTRKVRQASGVIVERKLVEVRGTDQKNLVVMLKTKEGDRRLLVDLGPEAALRDHDLKKGRTIAVEGVVVRLEDAQLFVANRFRKDGTTLAIARLAQISQAKAPPTDDKPMVLAKSVADKPTKDGASADKPTKDGPTADKSAKDSPSADKQAKDDLAPAKVVADSRAPKEKATPVAKFAAPDKAAREEKPVRAEKSAAADKPAGEKSARTEKTAPKKAAPSESPRDDENPYEGAGGADSEGADARR